MRQVEVKLVVFWWPRVAVVQRFRKLAVYFHRPQKGANRLKRLQHGVSTPLKVLTDCPTRWGSTMVMLQRLIELRPALDDFFVYLREEAGVEEFSDARSKLLRPTSEEWFVIQCLVELLEPFSATTEELGGSNYPTLVCALPGIRSLKLMLQDENLFSSLSASVQGEEFEPRVREMMESVRRSFIALVDKRFSELDEELLWIPLLDPRFTNTGLLSADERTAAGDRLVAEMLATAKTTSDANNDVTSPVPPTNESRLTPKKKMRVAYRSRLYGSRVAARPEATVDADAVLLEECKWEFNKYVRDSAVVHDEMNPLKWWKENRTSFPRIAPLARKWLGCIATSVPSERAFSTAGNTITKRRSALKANTVRDILFIAENKVS